MNQENKNNMGVGMTMRSGISKITNKRKRGKYENN